MPELPEVEVTRRQLLPLLLDRTIAQVRTTADSYFFITPPAARDPEIIARLDAVAGRVLSGG